MNNKIIQVCWNYLILKRQYKALISVMLLKKSGNSWILKGIDKYLLDLTWIVQTQMVLLISISYPSFWPPCPQQSFTSESVGRILPCTADTGFLFPCTKASTPNGTHDGSIPNAPSKIPLWISVVSSSSTLLQQDYGNPSFPSQKWLLRMTFPAGHHWARSPLNVAGPSHSLTCMQFIHQYSAFLSIHLWIFFLFFFFFFNPISLCAPTFVLHTCHCWVPPVVNLGKMCHDCLMCSKQFQVITYVFFILPTPNRLRRPVS